MLLSVSAWWLASPYAGIRHDGIFYAGDALRRLSPELLAGDPFFHRGSQGDFSAFGPLYAQLIKWLGLERAAFLLTLSGRVSWLLAATALVWALTPSRLWPVLLALALSLPREYGPLEVLARAEPFASPRLLAEATSLAALAFALRARWALAAVAWFTSMLMHPLMGVFAGAVVAFMLPATGRRWVGIVAAGLLALAWLMQLQPLPRLALQFDDAWWEVVDGRNAMILWQYWTLPQVSQAGLALLLLADVYRRLSRSDATRKLAAGLAITSVSCAVIWIWASYERNVLILQVQPWRVLWMLNLLAPVVWVATIWRASTALTLLPVSLVLLAWVMDSWAAFFVGALALWLQAKPTLWELGSRRRWVTLLVAGLALVELFDVLSPLLMSPSPMAEPSRLATRLAPWFAEPMLVMVTLLAALPVVFLRGAWRLAVSASAAGALLFSLAIWSSWMAQPPADAAERALSLKAQSFIPPGATVWSDLGLPNTWFYLQRKHYASSAQGAGAQFDRNLALALKERLERLRRLGLTTESWQLNPKDNVAKIRPSESAARSACQDQALDWLVFRGLVPAAHVVIQADLLPGRLSLFDCQRFRKPQDA